MVEVKYTTQQLEETINSAKISPETATWLKGQTSYLDEIIKVYVADPNTYGLHQDLQKNPLDLLGTVLNSADKLFGYQTAYDDALREIANANGIDPSNLDNIPEKLQALSLPRERAKIVEHYKSGGVIAVGLMGTGASGKGTIGKRTGMGRAVNFTTRPKRPGEEQGKDYFYIREMVPVVKDTLDIDTGLNVVGTNNDKPIYEKDEKGEPINYFDKYGPYLVTVHRPGRAKHGTSITQFNELFDAGNKAIFFEHGPVQIQEAGKQLPKHIENAKVVPVCILPPRRGVLPLAFRIAVRTYGDPEHKDPSIETGYKIDDSYLESTIGMAQIEELKMTANFVRGNNPLGIAYIVNDNLQEAVEAMKELVTPE